MFEMRLEVIGCCRFRRVVLSGEPSLNTDLVTREPTAYPVVEKKASRLKR
jgi:hypothetical protein